MRCSEGHTFSGQFSAADREKETPNVKIKSIFQKQVCLIAAKLECVSRPNLESVHKEDWEYECEHPCITIKIYFVNEENTQQCEEVECERLRHLIYWRKALAMNVFGCLGHRVFVERSERK